MRYLLSLILVIGFSSVSYAEGKFTCYINDIIILTSAKEANAYRVSKNSKLQQTDIIHINYDEKDINIIVTDEDLIIKETPQIRNLTMNKLSSLTGGKFSINGDKDYLDVSTGTIRFLIQNNSTLLIRNVNNRLELSKTSKNEWFGIITYHPYYSGISAHQQVPMTVTNIAVYCVDNGKDFSSLINYYNKNYNF